MGSAQAPQQDDVLVRKYAAWKKAGATPAELEQLVAEFDATAKAGPSPVPTAATEAPPLAPDLPTVAGMNFGRLSALGQGILRGAAALQVKPTTETAPDPMSKVPPEWQQQGQQQQMALEAQYPGTSQAGRIAGLVASPANKVFEAGAGLLATGRVAKAALAGGSSTAAVTAANRPEGTSIGQDVADVTFSALLGGGLAGAFAGAAPAYGKVSAKVGSFIDKHFHPKAVAAKQLNTGLLADRIDIAKAAAAAKPGQTVADLGGGFTETTLREAASNPVGEATDFRKMLEARDAARSGKIAGSFATETATPTQSGPLAAQAGLTKLHKTGVDKAYEVAREAGAMLPHPQLARLIESDNPILARATRSANEMFAMADKQLPYVKTNEVVRERGMNIPLIGTGKKQAIYNLDFADEVKRGIDDIHTSAVRGANPALDEARLAQSAKEKLVGVLDNLVDEYPKARALATQWRTESDALKFGVKIGAKPNADVRDLDLLLREKMPSLKSMDPASQAAVKEQSRQGVAYSLYHRMQGAGSDAQQFVNIFKSPNSQALARTAFPSKEAFAAFEEKVTPVMEQIAKDQKLLGNKQAVKALQPDAFGRVTPWAMAQALGGNPLLAATQDLANMTVQASKETERKAASELLKMGMTRVKDANGKFTPEFTGLLKRLQGPTQTSSKELPFGLLTAPGVFGAGLLNR